jgi:hypothetical protein
MTIKGIAAAAACALLAGCLAESDDGFPSDEASGGDEQLYASARRGIDYAWGRPAPGVMRANGYTFAARYLSYDTTGKSLTAGEAHALRSAGVDVVVVWEQTAGAALSGYGQGVSDARAAEAQARAAGMPDGRPIYFAVDFDASAGQQGAINSYLDGVASVIGRNRTGIYGGYYPVKRAFDAGKVRWGWQTYAWSGGQWDARAQLRQTLNGIYVDGVDCDRDEANAADFGQWGASADHPPVEDPGPRIAVAPNEDGRLEVVYASADSNDIGHVYETQHGWSALTSMGPYKAKNLAVSTNRDGRIEVVYVGTDDVIYHDFQTAPNAGWYGQVHLDGKAKQIAIAQNADGRLDVIYIGTNDAIYHNYQTDLSGHWSGEHELGGKAKQLTATQGADGAIEIFYVGTDDHIYRNRQAGPNGSFSGQRSMPGEAKQLAVAHHPDGRLEVFYIGTNDVLYHDWQTDLSGHWSGEHELGGKAKQLTASENADGRIEIFYVGTNDRIYHNYQTAPNAGWDGERALAGWAKQIAVGQNNDGRLEIFYIGTNDRLYHNWQTSTGGAWFGEAAL